MDCELFLFLCLLVCFCFCYLVVFFFALFLFGGVSLAVNVFRIYQLSLVVTVLLSLQPEGICFVFNKVLLHSSG